MKTRCNQKTFDFQTQNSRKIVAHFNGGNITSDAGGLLLRQAERVTGIISQFADRTSAATMRANQLRLWFSSVATNRFFQWKLSNSARRMRWLKASALKIDQFSAGTTNQLRYRGNRSLQQDTRPRQQPFQPSLTRKNSSKSESVRNAG